jgi:hypothetical protein
VTLWFISNFTTNFPGLTGNPQPKLLPCSWDFAGIAAEKTPRRFARLRDSRKGDSDQLRTRTQSLHTKAKESLVAVESSTSAKKSIKPRCEPRKMSKWASWLLKGD